MQHAAAARLRDRTAQAGHHAWLRLDCARGTSTAVQDPGMVPHAGRTLSHGARVPLRRACTRRRGVDRAGPRRGQKQSRVVADTCSRSRAQCGTGERPSSAATSCTHASREGKFRDRILQDGEIRDGAAGYARDAAAAGPVMGRSVRGVSPRPRTD
eukprot:365557-Chlamydomonas_euryale.AAC.9